MRLDAVNRHNVAAVTQNQSEGFSGPLKNQVGPAVCGVSGLDTPL